MFGSYSVCNIIVLLNMLIAMMNNSYTIISERSDKEWKFARSEQLGFFLKKLKKKMSETQSCHLFLSLSLQASCGRLISVGVTPWHLL